uniref:GNAT family N-acetyltransferase n=1 Tax=Algoriphagus sp. TaxID=1872435 RepID=UPI004048C133
MVKYGTEIGIVPFDTIHVADPVYLFWLNDPLVVKYLGRPEYFESVELSDLEAYYKEVKANKHIHFFAVYYLPDNKFIGTAKISLSHSYNNVYDIGDIGIMIGERSYWGKGLAKKILSTVCRYAVEELSVRKLTAGAISGNASVVKAFESIGFVVEGVLRKKIFLDDMYMDHILMGCFKEDFVESVK